MWAIKAVFSQWKGILVQVSVIHSGFRVVAVKQPTEWMWMEQCTVCDLERVSTVHSNRVRVCKIPSSHY